mgnify:CR=1 FL=1
MEADATGALSGVGGDLHLGGATSSPRATAQVSLRANLQSDATVPAAWDPTNAAGTSNFSTTTTIYDALGTAHDVTTWFRRTGAGTWEWHAVTDGGGVTGGTAGTATEIAKLQGYFTALALSPEEKMSVEDPVEMQRLADALPIERAASRWIVSNDPQEVVDKVEPYVKMGFRHLVFHAPGPDQSRFLKLFGEQVAPALRKKFG